MSKLTLAEAIAAGTDKGYLRVQEGAGGMVLERKVFASRKDGKVAVISKGKERLQKKSKDGASGARSKEMEDGQDSSTSLSNEAKHWRMAYMNMKKEQYAEKNEMEELLKLTLDRESQLASYGRLLSRKVDSLLDPIGDSTEAAKELSAKLEEQRKLLRLYEILTGIVAKEDDDADRRGGYVCTVKNRVHKKATKFSLRKDSKAANKDTSCHFVPLANLENLPDYVHTAIDFEPNMAPVILTDLLCKLLEDGDSEDEEDEK